jgi:subtilase family serine protease
MDGLTEIALEPYAEFVWADGGGGVSTIEPTPTYQQDTVLNAYPPDSQFLMYDPTPTSGDNVGQPIVMRSGADVAMLADPLLGVSVYDSTTAGGTSGWEEIGGTSLATPMFAAVVALANQQREINGLNTLGVDLNPALYLINNNEYIEPDDVSHLDPKWQDDGLRSLGVSTNFNSELLLSDFDNGGEFYDLGGAVLDTGGAAPTQGRVSRQGFDLSTGWGSPNVSALVPFASGANIAGENADDDTFNGEFLQVNLTNINTDGLGQPIYIPINNPNGINGSASATTTVNIKGTIQTYDIHSTPPTSGGGSNTGFQVDDYVGTGTATVTLGATPTLSFDLNTLDSGGNVLDFFFSGIPLTAGTSTAKYSYALPITLTGGGSLTGEEFWLSGTVTFGKNGGVSVSGSFYRIQGLNGNGLPIDWGKNGPGGGGGDVIGQFSS